MDSERVPVHLIRKLSAVSKKWSAKIPALVGPPVAKTLADQHELVARLTDNLRDCLREEGVSLVSSMEPPQTVSDPDMYLSWIPIRIIWCDDESGEVMETLSYAANTDVHQYSLDRDRAMLFGMAAAMGVSVSRLK